MLHDKKNMIYEYDACLKSWFNIFWYFFLLVFSVNCCYMGLWRWQPARSYRIVAAASTSPAWSLVHQRKNTVLCHHFWQTSYYQSFVLPPQCRSGQDRLLYRAWCNAGHGRVWRSGGHLQLCEDALLSSYQHDPDRGADAHITPCTQIWQEIWHLLYLHSDKLCRCCYEYSECLALECSENCVLIGGKCKKKKTSLLHLSALRRHVPLLRCSKIYISKLYYVNPTVIWLF